MVRSWPRNPCVNLSKKVKKKCHSLILNNDQLFRVKKLLLDSLKKGLKKETHPEAIIKCFPTYVQDLPNGKEKGKFLALDLGGTNFRVLIIYLEENHFDMKSKIYPVPEAIMLGTGTQLFDHIAECLATFTKENNVNTERLPLGFTFSFPLRQKALTTGLLERWTKGFNCSGVIGEDVVRLLREALQRRHDVQIDVCAILNDTTGTLMSCAWKNQNCRIGLIVGTGSNACYVEKTDEVETFNGCNKKPYVVVNTEWGAFGDDGCLDFIRTSYDIDLDKNSINPGKQVFEKMISGMYIGELVRLIIVHFIELGLLFNGNSSEIIEKKWHFLTKYVSEIESEKKGVFDKCQNVLKTVGIGSVTDEDCANVRYICQCVSRRAAHIVSAGIATLIDKIGQNNITVAVDGSVYRYHPHFHNLMMAKTSELLVNPAKFDFMLSEDGSGRGAALVAAVAYRVSITILH
ncbi:Hexokinase type, putative [Pediculus humanus corporis]|uniref:Phosphotransferase n=1 Tax=Pediculus humanus subsp. corporis TaxID=121224 RepID=E0VSJ4_PEDHC|nr:Hexokinase type, putative [Pediculus humanus corporis]EEB16350.1 Hexokinase type, putative [Pediculus humanus corporis]